MTGEEVAVRHLIVRGRVQGVFFRVSAGRLAERSGLVGWVRNREDGAVEIWLEGPHEGVAAVEEWIRNGGPPAARVEAVEVVPEAVPAGFDRFDVVRA